MVYGKSFLATHKHTISNPPHPHRERLPTTKMMMMRKKFAPPQDDFFSHPKNIPVRLPPKLLRPKSGLPMSISFCGPPAPNLFTSLHPTHVQFLLPTREREETSLCYHLPVSAELLLLLHKLPVVSDSQWLSQWPVLRWIIAWSTGGFEHLSSQSVQSFIHSVVCLNFPCYKDAASVEPPRTCGLVLNTALLHGQSYCDFQSQLVSSKWSATLDSSPWVFRR